MSEAAATCQTCGAPDPGDLVHCKYCRQPVSAEAQRTAIPCPRCSVQNRWGKQTCAQCQAWLVVSCVFCGAVSPHNVPSCLQCNEAFAGAPQRKAAMEAQQRQQQDMQMMSSVGSVVAPFLGAALGAAAGSALSGGSDWSGSSEEIERDDFDTSNVEEDTSSFDGGSSGDGGSSDW
jgi:hypothetical protein